MKRISQLKKRENHLRYAGSQRFARTNNKFLRVHTRIFKHFPAKKFPSPSLDCWPYFISTIFIGRSLNWRTGPNGLFHHNYIPISWITKLKERYHNKSDIPFIKHLVSRDEISEHTHAYIYIFLNTCFFIDKLMNNGGRMITQDESSIIIHTR